MRIRRSLNEELIVFKNLHLFTMSFLMWHASEARALDCVTPVPAPYFGNGMFNSREQAESNRLELQNFMSTQQLIDSDARVELAYNFSEAAAEQLLQVAMQKDEESGGSFFRWVSNLSSAPEFFRKLADFTVTAIDFKAYLEDVDLRLQIDSYEAAMNAGKIVVVVGHSQGNFYSNMSWELLQRIKSYQGKFLLVGVATPVQYIAGDGPYTTLTQDQIMNFVRKTKGALPANATNSTSSLTGHEFVSQYLEGSASRAKIVEDLKNVISKASSVVSTPTPAALEFLDKSLSPFLQYACKLKATKAKYTDGECIALAALNKPHGWTGEARSVRSLKSLNEWLDTCSTKEFWQNPDRFDFLDCSIFSSLPSMDPGGNTKAELDFVLEDHPECVWKTKEVAQRANAASVATARALLNSPPKEVRLGDR